MNRDLPASIVAFESRADAKFGIEAFGQIARDAPGNRFIAIETGDISAHHDNLARLANALAMAM